MSEFFRRYLPELLTEQAFRQRHPHFGRRVIPMSLLDHVTVPPLAGSELIAQERHEAALVAGDRIPAVSIHVLPESTTVVLTGGESVLAAARAADATELFANVSYETPATAAPFWDPKEPEFSIHQLTTEDGEVLIAEDAVDFVA